MKGRRAYGTRHGTDEMVNVLRQIECDYNQSLFFALLRSNTAQEIKMQIEKER